MFVRPFESAELVKGSDIILEGTVSGSPPFEISCLLNDKLSRPDKNHKISVENNTVTLHISNCESGDAGTYQCIVTNDVGETSCSCQITLKGQSEVKHVIKVIFLHAAQFLMNDASTQVTSET